MENRKNGARNFPSRYDLIAPLYDPILRLVGGKKFDDWSRTMWSKAEGQRILEVGVGTGRTFPYYPKNVELIAIDVSRNMLNRAEHKAAKEKVKVKLLQMDVQRLEFEDNYFHTVESALVFCAVSDPLKGLAEVKRVLRPGGKLVLLEHVISENRALAAVMSMMNPLSVLLMGEHITRRTSQNVEKSGFTVEKVSDLGGVFRMIEARKPPVFL